MRSSSKRGVLRLAVFCCLVIAATFLGLRHSFADTAPFEITDVVVSDISATATGGVTGYEGNHINNNVVFHKVGDSVTYKIGIKNVSNTARVIENVSSNYEGELFAYEFNSYAGDTVEPGSSFDFVLKTTYIKAVSDINKRNQNLTIKFVFKFSDGSEMTIVIANPSTWDNISIFGIILAVCVIGLLTLIIFRMKHVDNGKKVIIIAVLLAIACLPLPFVNASDDTYDVVIGNEFTLNDELVVRFVNEDRSEDIDRITVKYDEVVEAPEAPEIEGYHFDSWTTLDGEVFDIEKPILEDVTLVPKYVADDYTISYNLDGGTVSIANPIKYTIESEDITLNDPSKVGYSFKGWSGTDLSGNENKEVVITKGSTGNRSYKANYAPNSYYVKYNANGGDGVMPLQTMTYDVANNLVANVFTRSDYTFVEWNTKADGSGSKIANVGSVKNLTAENGATINLYAQWKEDFPLVFSQAGACVFNGVDGTITGEDCADHEGETLINTGIRLFSAENYNKDFEVSFNIDRYVTSEQDGLSDPKQPTMLNTKLENQDARYPGFTFRNVGGSQSDFEFTGVNPKNYNKFTVSMPISSTTKFVFRRVDGKFYYKINDGPFIYMNNDMAGVPAAIFDTPVTFGGSLLAVSNGSGGYSYTPFRVIHGTLSNMTIRLGDINTSNFKTVKFDGNGGSSFNTQYNLNDVLGTLPNSTRDGYIFDGWYTAKNGGNAVAENTVVTGNITFYAHWVYSVKKLSFETEIFTLDVGDTAQLIPTNSSEIAEEWTYSPGSSAIIDVNQDGLIIAKTIGKTYVRVRGKTSNQYKDLTVVVRGSVNDMTFVENPINVSVGNTFDALDNITNLSDIQEAFSFSSSDSSTFSVDPNTGIITAKKVGSNKRLRIKGSKSGQTVEIVLNVTD